MYALLFRGFGDLLGEAWLACGHVNQNGSRFAPGQSAIIAEEYFADILGEADDCENDIGLFCDCLRRFSEFRSKIQ